MNLVDSSGWLEYFADAGNADFFAGPILQTENLIVPAISLFEVFKRVLQQAGEEQAMQAVALMMQGHVVELDATTAVNAARFSLDLSLPMADSLILTTARSHDATLWTQDADFEGLDGVQFIRKQ
jgi:predicted nucleic acid-binding protein